MSSPSNTQQPVDSHLDTTINNNDNNREDDHSNTYSQFVGLLFIFNLIVGTGALALPKAFQSAGYVLSILVTAVSCLVSYMCATFILETMAIANAVKVRNTRRLGLEGRTPSPASSDHDNFQIRQRIEVTEMASMFLGRWGLIASYVTLTVYLFGDLAIYSSTVPKSIMNIICSTVNSTDIWPSTRWYDECRHGWPSVVNTRISIYRISVLLFVTLITPLVVVGITRTKYLQLSTSFCRWTAFALMICLAVISLIRDGPEGAPPAVHFSGFGSLFGTTVYAFMCQHSLPAIVTPIDDKKQISQGLFGIYLCVLAFYVALSLTGVFAFGIVFDVYTLNFLHDETSEESIFYAILNHFLALFPVFTLSTNYPIVATTLHNNLHVLYELIRNAFVQLSASHDGDDQGPLLDNEQPIAQLASQQPDDDNTDTQPSTTHSNTLIRVIILSLVIIIPTLIALLTDNVLLLASLTGSYPGVGVQFVIPSLLVIYARRCCKRELGIDVPRRSSSPFAANLWPWLMFVWAAFTTLMVTLNFYCL